MIRNWNFLILQFLQWAYVNFIWNYFAKLIEEDSTKERKIRLIKIFIKLLTLTFLKCEEHKCPQKRKPLNKL